MGKKELIASVLDKLLINRFFFYLSNLIYGPHIRVVNYHDTPPDKSPNFEAQLQFYTKYYSPCDYGDLDQFFKTGKWNKPKPGLIISFDDGLRDNIDNAVPLLEKYKFKGWFFIPSGIVDGTFKEQQDFVGKTEGRYKVNYPDGRYLMSWDELKYLYNNHVIGCHTLTHHRMNIKDNDQLLTSEITDSKVLMERKLGKPIDIYCWVGGEEHTYTREAAQKIKDSGYRFSFMTNTYPLTPGQNPLQIQRTNIETRNSLALVRFQLSILMDLYYRAKRNRVVKLTNV